MLHDLDASLAKLLERELAGIGNQLSISFLPPGPDFPPATVTPPAINLFLYDVREDREDRSGDWVIERDPGGAPTGRRARPLSIECAYLITAWASSASSDPARDEHRMLGEVVKALARNPFVPADVLQGELKDQEPPLPATSLQPGRLQSIAELWQASGSRPRAALTCSIKLHVESAPARDVGPATLTRDVRVHIR